MTRWLIVPLDDGSFEVRCRGKKARIFGDQRAAQRYVKKQLGRGDTVSLQEEDGYRTTITRSITRCR